VPKLRKRSRTSGPGQTRIRGQGQGEAREQAVGIFCTLCQQIPLAKCQVLRRCSRTASAAATVLFLLTLYTLDWMVNAVGGGKEEEEDRD